MISPLYFEDDIKKRVSYLNGAPALFQLSGFEGSSREFFVSEFVKLDFGSVVIVTADDDKCFKTAENLKFFTGRNDIYTFAGYDIKPYRNDPPSKEVVFQRIEALYALKKNKGIVVCSAEGLFQRTIPRPVFSSFEEYIIPDEDVDRDEFIRKIVNSGYLSASIVEEKGTFASRGYIVDIFPPAMEFPVRIEFFGDKVEALRLFDPETQRSVKDIEELIILPASEAPFDEKIVSEFKAGFENAFSAAPLKEVSEAVEKICIKRTGIENYIPLLFKDGNTLFDWIERKTPLFIYGYDNIYERLRKSASKAFEYYNCFCLKNLWLTPEKSFVFPDEVEKRLKGFHMLAFEDVQIIQTPSEEVPFIEEEFKQVKKGVTFPEISKSEGLKPVVEKLNCLISEGYTTILVTHLFSQAERLIELFKNYPLSVYFSKGNFPEIIEKKGTKNESLSLLVGGVDTGFISEKYKLFLLTEEDIFGERLKIKKRAGLEKGLIPSFSLDELEIDDYVVHRDYGIGRFKGLEVLTVSKAEIDFILIEYAGNDKLYIPVQHTGLIQTFTGGNGSAPRLDKLGGTSWERAKQKVKEAVREMADELLKLYALRGASGGFRFSNCDTGYREFEARFEKEETPDQLEAISAVIRDMESHKIMDRLVCGDVGYGKTEVAVRAAYKAAMDGKQVALLVPTTVLAQQHYLTFLERFKEYPVNIEALSRFKTKKEQDEILKKIKLGTVDIVIGTHRLLQKDVAFKDIGLLIIDEEQRFGVTDKEKIKKIKSSVDVLTLTATPIPRTLNMTLSGLRDVSTINTPPEDRLSIKTYVVKFSPEIIREAVTAELERGGQVFFVHNRVKSIYKMRDYLKRIVPEASIAVAHGQMGKEELENVMLDYLAKKYNLLLSTAIIESGLDIPSANTIIINRADHFGLAQLYQLRGRVGRSHRRAYSYLLIPGEKAITSDAKKRLEVLRKLTELGSGIKIALHDLEIRGAGALLGREQSGNIAQVGFDMYMELLENAVKEIKGEEIETMLEPEVNLGIPVFIPSSYIEDSKQRFVIYRRIGKASTYEQLKELKNEIIDRFGRLPHPLSNLIEVMSLKNSLKKAGIKELKLEGKGLVFTFDESAKISPEKIVNLISSDKNKYSFTPDLKLISKITRREFIDLIAESKNILHNIQ